MRRLGTVAAALALAACETAAPRVSPVPAPRPTAPAPAVIARAAPSAQSAEAASFYRRVEARLLSQGRLRRDRGGPDAPFGVDDVVRTFERVALFSEFVQIDGRYVAQQARSKLRRWPGPVRVQVRFGASVPADVRAADTATLRRYLDRLSRLTGHPIALVPAGGNFQLFVASVDEQRALAPAVRRAEPSISGATAQEITSLGRDTYCVVYALSSAAAPEDYVAAVALVRAEHPDLMRLACYHEELAQGLGLANDSPTARPSIFNDDEEFALLTAMDEILLRILYDPRLRIGMTAEEARPVVRRIAAELLASGDT